MMQQAQAQSKRDIPLWLGITLVTIGVAVAAWFVWSQISGFWGSSGVFQVEGVDPTQPRPAAPIQVRRQQAPAPVRQNAVRAINDTNWRVRAGQYTMTARKTGDDLRIGVLAGAAQLLPKDSQWVLMTKGRLNSEAIADIGLTDEQVKQFKSLPTSLTVNLKPAPDQLQKLTDLFSNYLAAAENARPPLDQQLATELANTAASLVPQAKQNLQDQYDNFRKTVTDQQWEKLKALGTTPAPAQ